MRKAAIGTSMLEFLKQSEPENNNDDPPRSILHSLVPDGDRIIVKGSHATSIAMNMAHEIASQCRCNAAPCRCVAVDFLMLSNGGSSSNKGEPPSFPLFCLENPKYVPGEDVLVKLRNLENSNSTWNPRALRRIRVKHFRSARDLMAYLFKIHASDQRPWGAIIVDGLDTLVMHGKSGHSNTSLSSEQAMLATQILAILAETGCTLQRTGGAESLRLVATMQSRLPPNVERIVGNWFPHIVTMEQLKVAPGASGVPIEDKVQSSWSIKVGNDDGIEQWGFSVVEKKPNGTKGIVWGQQHST